MPALLLFPGNVAADSGRYFYTSSWQRRTLVSKPGRLLLPAARFEGSAIDDLAFEVDGLQLEAAGLDLEYAVVIGAGERPGVLVGVVRVGAGVPAQPAGVAGEDRGNGLVGRRLHALVAAVDAADGGRNLVLHQQRIDLFDRVFRPRAEGPVVVDRRAV